MKLLQNPFYECQIVKSKTIFVNKRLESSVHLVDHSTGVGVWKTKRSRLTLKRKDYLRVH